MKWQEVIENPSLQNLPFKIETDETGKIIMSAVKVRHSLYQGEIAFLMRTMRQNGFVMSECAVRTRKGTKAADVAWASVERVLQIRDAIEAVVAPEVCAKVLSASNTIEEMNEKRVLYFESGAIEFWTCSENGVIRFFNTQGELKQSILFPDFPIRIEIQETYEDRKQNRGGDWRNQRHWTEHRRGIIKSWRKSLRLCAERSGFEQRVGRIKPAWKC